MARALLLASARRSCLLVVVLVGATALVAGAAFAGRSFVWNISPSLPRGLYAIDRSAVPTRGAVVTFRPSRHVATMIAARSYLPAGMALLKIVVAIPGDHVCVDDLVFTVNHRIIGAIARHDSAGRPLVPFRFCAAVPPGHAFVATASPLSFDSRYFGPAPLSDLTVVVPAWTY